MTIKDESHILSFITNFGCHFSCSYCVTKKSGIKIPKTTVKDLCRLEDKILKSDNGLISISGGGDPLFEYENNKSFYDELFSILKRTSCCLEMHTCYLNSSFPYENCYRIVYHMTGLNKIGEIQKVKRHKTEKIRIVFVVEPCYSENDIMTIYGAYLKNDNIDQLSFRQIVYSDFSLDTTLQTFLEIGHSDKKWFYIKQNDYNTYIVGNKNYSKFKEIK